MDFLYTLAYQITPEQIGVEEVNANDVVIGVLNTAYYVAGIAAIIVIIIAGIMYTTSSGDPGKTKTAREAIIYAVTGLVIVGMAFFITGFVAGRF